MSDALNNLLILRQYAEQGNKPKVLKTLNNLALNVLFFNWKGKFNAFDNLEELKAELELLDGRIEGSMTTGYEISGSNTPQDYKYFKEECITKKIKIEKDITKELRKQEKKLKKFATEVGMGFIFPETDLNSSTNSVKGINPPAPKLYVCDKCNFFYTNESCECN